MKADSNAALYNVEVSNDNFETMLLSETLIDTSFTTPQLEFDSGYLWRVRGTNSAGDGEWSQIWSFTTIVEQPETDSHSS